MEIGIGVSPGLSAQFAGGAALPPLNAERAVPLRLEESGLSWTNTTTPVYVDLQAEYFGTSGDVTTNWSIINGSDWSFRWANDSTATGGSARARLEAGSTDALVIIDNDFLSPPASSFANGVNWRDACEAEGTEMFVWMIHRAAPAVAIADYADPLDVPAALWQDVADYNVSLNQTWRDMVQYLRDTSADPLAAPVRYIPWPLIYAKIIEEFLAGEAPSGIRPESFLGGTNPDNPWYDNHPSALGMWCTAMARIAVVWRRNPGLLPTPATLGVVQNATALAAFPLATYQWLGNLIWQVCQEEPLADVRAWDTAPDFILTSVVNGQAQLYKTPDLDPANLPASFDAAIRLEGDTGNGTVQTGLNAVPATWTGLETGNWQARRHPSGLWSPFVAVQRVVPELITTVATMPLYRGAPGVSEPDANSFLTITGLPSGTQAGDIMIWVLGQTYTGTSNWIFAEDHPEASQIFYDNVGPSPTGQNWHAAVYAGLVSDTTDTYRFARIWNRDFEFIGALLILRGADLSTIQVSSLDSAVVTDGNAYVQMPALTVPVDASIEYLLTMGRQGSGLGFSMPTGYTAISASTATGHQHHISRRLVDSGAQERPLILFPGARENDPLLTAFRMSIGPT